MVLLADIAKEFFDQYGNGKKIWIAYSGGIDSHVLLHIFASYRLQNSFDLNVIHINHGLNPLANEWQQHCANICTQLNVNFLAKKIDNQVLPGESPEALARKRRYAVFKELLSAEEILLTAHQQDDQAETLLIQLFRGAGPKGLAAMPKAKKFGAGFLVRPLLNYSRIELHEYAVKHQLHWIEDDSNKNIKFSRNFIRHEIMPVLKKRWPTITKTIARSAKQCGDMQNLLNAVMPDVSPQANNLASSALCRERHWMPSLALVSGMTIDSIRGNKLSVSGLTNLEPSKQRHILRHWLSQNNISLPSEKKLFHLQKDLLSANQDKNPHIVWGEYEARRYQDFIYVMLRKLKHDPKQVYTWDLAAPLVIKNIGSLKAISSTGNGLRADIQQVTVRFRQGGERLQLPGRTHTHCLKKLFQEWKIPPWERDRIPLIYVENELAAVVGFFIANKFAGQLNEPSMVIENRK